MCVGDHRLGRLIRSRARVLTLDALTNHEVVPRDPNRVGLILASSNGVSFQATPDDFAPTNANGIRIISGFPQTFTLIGHGDLPTRRWLARESSAASGPVVMIIELFLPADTLNKSPDAIKSDYHYLPS